MMQHDGTDEGGTLLQALAGALRRAGTYNRDDQAPPVAVLWPDHERQWEPLVPLLRNLLPVLTLGPYAPAERTGPSYWIRCMLARTLPEDVIPADQTPIIYLPGISKQDIRAVESCPPLLQPLAELQYSGTLWTQVNGKDWTVPAFIQTTAGGLGIELAGDTSTKEALGRALLRLADEPVARMRKEAPLRAPFFDALLNPDTVRSLLQWLNDPQDYPKRCAPAEWASFCALCRANYGFDPAQDGPVTAAGLLGEGEGAWSPVWERFAEAPRAYPHLPEQLRRARPPQLSLLSLGDAATWPQDNEAAEARLQSRLQELGNLMPAEARTAIAGLESEHAARRSSVWATLGQAPLVEALRHLALLAAESAHAWGGARVRDIATAYAERGWRVDAAAVDALAAVEHPEQVKAVRAVLTAIYRPWLMEAATAFQQAAGAGDYQAGTPVTASAGTCLLFCDALRFDAGKRLADELAEAGLDCGVDWRLAALPGVTPTAKPAISPVAGQVAAGTGLDTAVAATGTRLNVDGLRKLLANAGYDVLRGDDLGDPSGRGWTEHGAIDAYGHEHGWRVAHHLPAELRGLCMRVKALLDWGWKQVVVITDHGWLLLPGGLPKAELPEHLTDARKGRCARLKDGAQTDYQTVSWHWDVGVRIALAPGIHCFEAGKEYEHGGLSPQECVVPMLTVRGATGAAEPVTIASVKWTGLRCRVRLASTGTGLSVDIRTKPADASTSVVTAPKSPGSDGQAALVVPRDDLDGTSAVIVVLDAAGAIVVQQATLIGA